MGTAARSPPVAVTTPPSSASPHAASPLPALRPDFGDDTLFTVYCFIRDFIGSSGTSAVAIDNKIEQAMDLVKSHLMFAVREEVEVLKEKIVELTGRINQLEYENTVLKAHATQETLQQLAVPPQLPVQQQQPIPQQQPQSPAPQSAPASATAMMGGGGGKAQQAPTSVS